MLPARAPPVPFCLCNLRVDPAISLRCLVLCVPWRWLARYCFTSKYIAWSLGSMANTDSGSCTLAPVSFPDISKTLTSISLFVYNYVRTFGSRYRATDHKQVLVFVHLQYLEVLYFDPLASHTAGHALSFENAGRPRSGTQRTWGTEPVVLAVRRTAHATKAVALHHTLEALTP